MIIYKKKMSMNQTYEFMNSYSFVFLLFNIQGKTISPLDFVIRRHFK